MLIFILSANNSYIHLLFLLAIFFFSPHYNVPLLYIKANKRVATYHDVYHLVFIKTLPLFQKLYTKVVFNLGAFITNKIVTVSEFSLTEIKNYIAFINAKKISVIKNGIDLGEFENKENNEDKLILSKYKSNPYLLYVGNIKPHKNVKIILSAYVKIITDHPDFHYNLLIVGKREGFLTGDPEVKNFIQESTVNNRIYFTDFVSRQELVEIFKNADLFIFPSLYEGFGLPPLEAMAAGCVALVSDIPSLRETCGNSAIYFNPTNSQDLAGKILDIISNKPVQDAYIQKGIEHVKYFSWKSSALKHIQVFNQL